MENEAISTTTAMNAAEAVKHLLQQTGDPNKFRSRKRGYVDWKFGELCEYLGYAGALAYVESMRNWYNYESNFKNCLLAQSYEAFLQAQQQLS